MQNPLNVGDGYDGLTCHREDLIIDSEPGCFGGRTLFHPANRGDLLWVEVESQNLWHGPGINSLIAQRVSLMTPIASISIAHHVTVNAAGCDLALKIQPRLETPLQVGVLSLIHI